ncbi:ATP-binding cassette (ABC) Superfamily [Phytophthora cinnamomi]|uniref:ATP-binding cassette (ABC) Superfamily n=1 Tax=Phytophthora cinnamomi TaxID=4785 RepID=UPI003559C5A4|nr:ATP-binding cassette (ABC) Superfamily [Phytophthora cinnamomi]
MDWDSPEFSCTKAVYSGEGSQEEENTAEGGAQDADDKKQATGDVPDAPADPDTQAEEPSSEKTGTEPMAAPPVKNLTLADARASKAAAAVEDDVPGGKKRAASKLPPRDGYRGLFDDSESEEGAVDYPREVSNDLDEQQAQITALARPPVRDKQRRRPQLLWALFLAGALRVQRAITRPVTAPVL